MFTDAANAYTSVMSGFPNTTERFLRINLSYIRDLSPLVVLTYIDKNYNLSDSGTKTEQGKHTLLQMAMQYNWFKFGFIGRKNIRETIGDFEKTGKRRIVCEKKGEVEKGRNEGEETEKNGRA